MRAVEAFGFHLASLDLRQNSDVHEAVVADLLACAQVEAGLRGAGGAGAGRAAGARARHAASALVAAPALRRTDTFGTRDPRDGRGRPPQVRRSGAAQLRDLEVPVGLRPARGRGAAEGGRAAGGRPARARHRAAVRDDRRSRALRADHARRVRGSAVPPPGGGTRRLAGGDARLFRQQQGRRLPDGQLGALSRRDAAGRGVPRARRQAPAVPRPGRHRRPRRRTVVRGDPRAAGRQRDGRAARDRAGRDHREQVLRSGTGAAQPRGAGRGDDGGEPRRRGTDRRAGRRVSRGAGPAVGGRVRRVSLARLRNAGVRRVFPRRDADRRDRRAQHRQPARVAHGVARASRTCARSRGCSAGGSAG